MSEKEPIISKWEKGEEVEDKKIASGFVSGETGKAMGVRRKVFETDDGKKFYVYKEVASLEEAQNTMRIYRIFKDSDLPVVDFAKIIKKKAENKDEFIIAMEDLTENGRLKVLELSELGSFQVYEDKIIEKNNVPFSIKENIIKSLATIHNAGIYDYHPGISIVVRAEKTGRGFRVIDFKIIDYANFQTVEMGQAEVQRGAAVPRSFEEECDRDIKFVARCISNDNSEKEHLLNLYWDFRKEAAKRK